MAEQIEKSISGGEKRMKRAVESLEREFAGVRTGRATPALLDTIKVDYYGTNLPINQLATISIPEARLMVIAPWDQGSLQAIERAIMTSDLGLTPHSDGKVIRLQIPTLTEERRKDLAKVVSKMAEEGKVGIRKVRREINDELDKLEKRENSGVSEDDVEAAKKRVQHLTEQYIEQVDHALERKVQEIMEE
jgi:ribosome recycling factor